MKASRFTVSQIAGRVVRFKETPEEAVASVKAANRRGGKRGAISRRKR